MAQMEFCQVQFYDKYVDMTMRCLPDKFIELCHRHLAVLLDLSGDKLELLLSGHEEQKKKKLGFPSVGMFKKKDKSQGLFGLPLTDEGVCLMMPLIQFLKMKKNVRKEGLFRKPGNKNRMTTLRDHLIAHGPTVSIDPKIFFAHDVACVLKEFIRELPEPLLSERHLEAHMQILALGQHAKTPEEIDCFSSRKLSALQLLMLLLPSPAQKLTMHLVQLLQRVAGSPESKMTSATLGTIFAPIFIIERKVQPTDLHNQITTTAPAVSFLIDKAHELFQSPRELVTDLTRFWKSMRQSFLHAENREYDQLQESLSDQTSVNYADSELCDYDASNITAGLVNLLEKMQTHNAKPKKFVDAPEFCAGLRKRSKSIGSSIKKRLQSIRHLRNRERDMLKSRASSSSSSNSDSKTATSAWTRLFTQTSEARHSLQLLKPGQKRRYTLENCPTAVSSSSSNSLIKKKCQETATCSVTLTAAGNQKQPKEAGEELLSPSRYPANVVSDVVENRNPKDLTSGLEDPATCDIENIGSATCNIESKDSTHRTSHLKGEIDSVNTCMFQRWSGRPRTGLSLAVAKCKVSFQSETSHDYLPQVTTRKITMAVTASKHSNRVANTCQQPSRKPKTATSDWTRLFTQTSEARHSFVQLLRLGQKRRYTLENCPTAVSSSSSNSLIKKKCQETATCSVTLTAAGNQKQPKEAGCESLLTPSGHPANVLSDFVENINPKDLTSGLEDPATCDIENKENIGSAICNIESKDSTHRTSHLKGETDPVNTCMFQRRSGRPLTGLSLTVAKCKVSSRHLDRPDCFQSETSHDYLPHVTTKKITMAVTASKHSNPVTNTCQQPSKKPKTATSDWTRLFTQTSEARHSFVQLLKPGQKRRYTLENCPTAVSSSSSNSLIKKKCQETATCSVTLTAAGNQKQPKEAGCELLLTPSGHPANVLSDFVENINPKDLTSGLEDPATCDIENKENIGSATCNIESKDSTHRTSHLKGETDPVNTCMFQRRSGRPLTGLSLTVAKCKVSGRHLDRPDCFQSETSHDYLPHVTTKKITMAVTASKHSNPVTNTCQQPSKKPKTTAMAQATNRLNQNGFRETAL